MSDQLFLYIVSRLDEPSDEDCEQDETYEAVIVAARNENEARRTHPAEGLIGPDHNGWGNSMWVSSPDQTSAWRIGVETDADTMPGVLMASVIRP